MPIALVPVLLAYPRAVLRTSGLAAIAHPELELAVREDRVPAPQLHWLADSLCQPVLAGTTTWEDGDVLPLGWTDIRLTARGDVLVVEAWSFADAAFTPDVSVALEPLGAMNRLLEARDALDHGIYPSGHQRFLGLPGPSGRLDGERVDATGDDSGWRITGATSGPLHALVSAWPAVLPALALPAGSAFEVVGDALEVVRVGGLTA